jgi:hypothetical protein
VNRFEFRSDQEEQPGAPGREVEMKKCRTVVVIAIAFVLVSSATAWSDEPGLSEEDIATLYEIFEKIPVKQTIRIDSVNKHRVGKITVHRCQKVEFRVVGGNAAISIMDEALANANRELLDPEYDVVAGKTIVLQIDADRPAPPSILVPKNYPNPGHEVEVRYYTECFDPETKESYECEGGSAPIIIIPRFP